MVTTGRLKALAMQVRIPLSQQVTARAVYYIAKRFMLNLQWLRLDNDNDNDNDGPGPIFF